MNIITGSFKNSTITEFSDNFNFDDFSKCFTVEIINLQKGDSIPFKCICKKAPLIFHQTLRKTILRDVPCIAFDRIYGYEFGSSLDVVDVVKAIGLIPIDVNPDKLSDYENLPKLDEIDHLRPDACLYFQLDVTSKSSVKHVYSGDYKWITLKKQNEKFLSSDVNIDKKILLNILFKNERIKANCLAIKGYGWDHAKFQPTCCAIATPKPVLTIDKFKGDDAILFQSLFPKGVIKIVKNRAVVDDVWKFDRINKTVSYYSQFDGKYALGYDESEYMWTIESIRPINQPAHQIFVKAIDVVLEKCQHYIDCMEKVKDFVNSYDENDNFKSPEKIISGRNRYITIKNMDVSQEYPAILFHNEDNSITQSLLYVIRNMYKSSVICNDIQSDSDVLVRIEASSENKYNLKGCEMLINGFEELSKYYSHMQSIFLEKIAQFDCKDVEME